MKVYKNNVDYVVLIDSGDAYEMNEHANMPNGVCIYLGNVNDTHDSTLEHLLSKNVLVPLVRVPMEDVPIAILEQANWLNRR